MKIPDTGSTADPSSVRISWVVVCLGCILFCIIPNLHFRSNALHAVDYKTVYSSARCLPDGCNPYDSAQIDQAYRRGGGDVSAESDMSAFAPFQALYPPSALFWFVPFALFPWTASLILWIAVSAILFVLATLAMVDLCRFTSTIPFILIGLFTATSTMLLSTAQPSTSAISLCVLGIWCLVTNRFPIAGIAAFALSLTIKPQLGGLILIYFLLAGGLFTRRFFQIAATTVLLSLPGIIWASSSPSSAHWMHDMSVNLAGGATPGHLNDPGPTGLTPYLISDLQAVFSLFSNDPSFYNHVTWVVVGVLLLLWAYVAWRAPASIHKTLLGIAAIACIDLLPVYHRHYDIRILLLTFPAIAQLIQKGGLARVLAILVGILSIVGTHPDAIKNLAVRHLHALNLAETLIFLRPAPLVLLMSAMFYLTFFFGTLKQSRPTGPNAGLVPSHLSGGVMQSKNRS
jgi:Glycosyltransferase family 87